MFESFDTYKHNLPATGHLDTGFSWFLCVYKQMLTDGSQHSKLPLHASHVALPT